MKAFLMFKGRDFDPHQLLARRDNELRHRRGKEQGLELQQILPWNEAALRQDLGLDIIFDAMAQGDRFLLDAVQVGMLSSLTDLETIQYRQEALSRLLQAAPALSERCTKSPSMRSKAKGRIIGGPPAIPRASCTAPSRSCRSSLPALKRLRYIADRDKDKFKSAAFSNLIAMLRKELSDDYFAEVENHLKRLKFRAGVLVSAHLGKGNKGANYVLRAPQRDDRNWLSRLLGEKPQELYVPASSERRSRRASPGRTQRSGCQPRRRCPRAIDGSYSQLLSDAEGGVGVLYRVPEFACQARGTWRTDLLAGAAPAGARTLSFANLYDAALALSRRDPSSVTISRLMARTSHCDRREHRRKIHVLAQPWISHVMMQAGMFVPAEQFRGEGRRTVHPL